MKRVINEPVCVDDHGDEVYVCQYTHKPVTVRDSILLGPIVPSVPGTYVCAPDAKPARRESMMAFNEMEANCNTCAMLTRVPHPKSPDGFLLGKCYKGERKFHPDDPMGMSCWVSRET